MKRSWMKRSVIPMKRIAFRVRVNEDKPSLPQLDRSKAPLRGGGGLSAGRRMKEWRRVWQWLKPRLEAVGRVRCEFDFLTHDCRGPLDPAHSKKRNQMQDMDIYAVALACRTIHDYLDGVYVYPPLGRRMDHGEMETAVWRAINAHGGVVLPAKAA